MNRAPHLIEGLDEKQTGAFYRRELTDNVLPFWLAHGLDREHGGWLTCVDREGRLFSTDKSVWFQGRGTYTFAAAYRRIEPRPEYKEAAASGFRFFRQHCYDTDGRMFFQVTRDGRPIQKRRYWFSESFAVVASAEQFRITGDREALELARSTWATLRDVVLHPEKAPPKYYPTRPMKALASPMIQIVTAQVLRDADPERAGAYTDVIAEQVAEIRRDFLKSDRKALLENVGPRGETVEGPKGRLVNPGHAIECSWFLMAEARRTGDAAMLDDALKILDWSLAWGWDTTYGGLYSFIDIEGRPCEALEWDMKLWWPHTEAFIALAMAWKLTGKPFYRDEFVRLHNWSWSRFADPVHGDWYGYLHRDGSVANFLKGNLFKGPFHLPRALMIVSEIFENGILP